MTQFVVCRRHLVDRNARSCKVNTINKFANYNFRSGRSCTISFLYYVNAVFPKVYLTTNTFGRLGKSMFFIGYYKLEEVSFDMFKKSLKII